MITSLSLITAGNSATVSVSAQASLTNASLIVVDEAGNQATATQSVILGTAATDSITGTDQSDFIFGFDGADIIDAGSGADIITSGSEADTFKFTSINDSAASISNDTIVTFDKINNLNFGGVQDKIDLTDISSVLVNGTLSVGHTTTFTESGGFYYINSFYDLKLELDKNILTASSASGLQAYIINLTGNEGSLGKGKYLVVNNNDTELTSSDLMIEITGISQGTTINIIS